MKVDFNCVRQSTMTPNWKLAHRLVLKDAGRTLVGATRASVGLAAPPPSRQELEALHNKFWTWCWYVFGKIARGELWEALDGVHTIRSLALVPIAEWDANRRRDGHRRLESRLDAGYKNGARGGPGAPVWPRGYDVEMVQCLSVR